MSEEIVKRGKAVEGEVFTPKDFIKEIDGYIRELERDGKAIKIYETKGETPITIISQDEEEDEPPEYDAFINWKDTNLCLTLYCDCGERVHVDGFFAWNIQCPYCNQVYKMPRYILLERVEEVTDDMQIVVGERDEN